MKVLVIPEDFRKDQYNMLKFIITGISAGSIAELILSGKLHKPGV